MRITRHCQPRNVDPRESVVRRQADLLPMSISLTAIGRRLCSFGGLCLHVFLLVVVHWQDALLLMYNLPFKSALRTPTDIYDRENRFRDPSASRDQLLWAPGSTTHASGKAIATAPPTLIHVYTCIDLHIHTKWLPPTDGTCNGNRPCDGFHNDPKRRHLKQ